MNMQEAIRAVTEKQNLSSDDMTAVMRIIMTGEATPAQIGGFLIGLRMKGETIDEIAAAAKVMRELATGVKVEGEHVVDIVGTGGDASNTFNISTASSFVVAAAGGIVAKHGNRSISSKSGSADLLEAAGVNLDLNAEQVAQCIKEIGVGFMFAPKHHSAMKHAIGPRKEMGVRTIFNVLGPLTNPAGAPNQLLGVFAEELVDPLAEVLNKLGSHHVLVVHSTDGMDEISICDKTHVRELKNDKISSYVIDPKDFGIKGYALKDVLGKSAGENAKIFQQIIGKKKLVRRLAAIKAAICLNAGAGIYLVNKAKSIKDGYARAQKIIESKKFAQYLKKLK